MKNLQLLCLLFLALAAGCKPSSAPAAANTPVESEAKDIAGLYAGTLPCPDCDGIETSLTLSEGMVYTLEQKYLGKSPALTTQQSGKFTLNLEGKTITLEGLDAATQPTKYLFRENDLVQLGPDGNSIAGDLADKYILTRQ